jgi:hypothetical protein
MKLKDKVPAFTFDKFINDIQKKEDTARKKVEEHQARQEEHPGRRYNRLYRERWQNRIRYGRK